MAVTRETTDDGIDPFYYYSGYASTVYRALKRPLITLPETASDLRQALRAEQEQSEEQDDDDLGGPDVLEKSEQRLRTSCAGWWHASQS